MPEDFPVRRLRRVPILPFSASVRMSNRTKLKPPGRTLQILLGRAATEAGPGVSRAAIFHEPGVRRSGPGGERCWCAGAQRKSQYGRATEVMCAEGNGTVTKECWSIIQELVGRDQVSNQEAVVLLRQYGGCVAVARTRRDSSGLQVNNDHFRVNKYTLGTRPTNSDQL